MVTGKRLGHPVRQIKNQFAKDYAKAEYSQISDEELEKLGSGACTGPPWRATRKPATSCRADFRHDQQRAARRGIIQEMFQEGGGSAEGAGKWVR